MAMAAKVLWGEGQFLRPQHFQRQDQYHETRLQQTASALHPYAWGVAHMQWDLDALKAGTLRLHALSAIFRDGEVFDAAGDDGGGGGDSLPPAVDLAALPAALQEVTDALQAKVEALHSHHREPSRNVIEFRSGDVSSFWLLHTASTAATALMHYARHPALHPERLYEALLSLAGGLLSYARHHTLASLPVYDHAQPGACFAAIDAIIRELLDTVISSKYFSIALVEGKPSYYLGKLDSGKVDQHTTLYLAIRAALPAIELVDIVPLRVKVGAPDDVEKCVLSAMPGVKLSYAPQVPAAIPVRAGTYYFALESRGGLYEHMLKAQSISVYVPSGIRELQLELIAVTA